MFDDCLARWALTPDGAPIITRSSRLLPVRRPDGEPAMLKIAVEPEEQWGAALMVWWNGDGAARVLAQAEDTLLLERATGHRSLAAMAREGHDDEASRILCGVAARLHGRGGRPAAPPLVPLTDWFAPLVSAPPRDAPLIRAAAATARALLAAPQDMAVLHGDLHHENVLDAGARGWLAIDPKRLGGERGFDFANIFRNPDHATAIAPGRLARQAHIVSEAAALDRVRLLQWILALAGLSASWLLDEGSSPTEDLEVAEIARAELLHVGVRIVED